jgi:hypothetical protein
VPSNPDPNLGRPKVSVWLEAFIEPKFPYWVFF